MQVSQGLPIYGNWGEGGWSAGENIQPGVPLTPTQLAVPSRLSDFEFCGNITYCFLYIN